VERRSILVASSGGRYHLGEDVEAVRKGLAVRFGVGDVSRRTAKRLEAAAAGK
jgi:hypothetical protein